MTAHAHGGPVDQDRRSLTRQAVASNGFSMAALLFAVLSSVVGAVFTAQLGTGQVGRLAGAAIGPVISTTFTTWWSGGRGRIQLAAIGLLTLLALGVTVSGFFVADTVADKPVLGDGSGSLVPSGVPPAVPDSDVDPASGTNPPVDPEPGPLPELSFTAEPIAGGTAVTVTNNGTAGAGPFAITVNGVEHTQIDSLLAETSTAALAVACPDPLLTELTIAVVLSADGLPDADESNNEATVPVTCTE
ncbi:MAG: hypothetical protein ACRDO7_15870 [Nocardioidaceae bacterium]